MTVFTTDYAKSFQTTFLTLLEEHNYEHAYDLLMKFPSAKNSQEELERLLLITQGLDALFSATRSSFMNQLKLYTLLGSPERIAIQLHVLSNYRALGTLEEVRSKLDELERIAIHAHQIGKGYRKL